MLSSPHAFRWLQILLTIFYGQIVSTGIYEYFLQGLCGLIFRLRPKYDSILLLILALLMFAFVVYAIIAVWFCRIRMSIVAMLILLTLFVLTLVQSILELRHMGFRPTRLEWMLIRIIELIFRFFAFLISVVFLCYLRQGYKPNLFQLK